jgi:hypothetical protein
MVSRSERFYGTRQCLCNKGKVFETGNSHEILINCGVEDEGSKSNVLCCLWIIRWCLKLID